jgi:Tfp pilus assembly protein PilF
LIRGRIRGAQIAALMAQLSIQQAFDLASRHQQTGRLREAEELYHQILAMQPEHTDALRNLGLIAQQAGRYGVAADLFRRAILLKPNFVEAQNDLGNALAGDGHLDEAIAAFRRAIALNPNLPEAHNNLGTALKENGQLEEAVAVFRRAIALSPTSPECHYNLSMALLTKGDFQEGWEEYEWRWKCKTLHPPRNFVQPRWDGSPLAGRTILLHSQQGFGDAIQFVRYVPLVAQRGGKIVLECYPELQRIFQTMAGSCQIVVRGQPLPPFDFHCSLVSLPRIFGTNLADVPKTVPYLRPDPVLVDAWSKRLGTSDGQIRVGLVWAGRSKYRADRTRSLNLQQLAPFARVRGVKFFSLQKGPGGEQAKNPPAGLELVDLGPELNDFADTAAVMSLLDLSITSDTSVPHLAGAMARPIWLMLQFVPSFRWLLEREDMPWYPTMRLFRQPRLGDWDSVIARVVDELCLLRGGR